jgi:hypothetical protein
MRDFPPTFKSPRQQEFEAWKTCEEWHAFFKKKILAHERMYSFCGFLSEFAANDLAYIDRGMLVASAEEKASLEYIAGRLEKDSPLLAALYCVRLTFDGTRATRWRIQVDTMKSMGEARLE